MARRTLSTQGRILAAGVSVAVGGLLAGFMAAGDHTAGASPTSNGSVPNPASAGTSGGTSASPDDGGSTGAARFPAGSTGSQLQPQTRTGGS